MGNLITNGPILLVTSYSTINKLLDGNTGLTLFFQKESTVDSFSVRNFENIENSCFQKHLIASETNYKELF